MRNDYLAHQEFFFIALDKKNAVYHWFRLKIYEGSYKSLKVYQCMYISCPDCKLTCDK